MAVDAVSIIIAVVSLIGSLVAAGFTGWITYYVDQVKRRQEARALVHKYRDPLMLAAYDLQSRIWGLVQMNLLYYHADADKYDLVYVYTAFLIGQYLSWTYVLRRQAQFLRFSTDTTNTKLSGLLDRLANEFATDQYPGAEPFMLWRGQQMAIGELMTLEEEGGQLYCIGFAAFAAKYHHDEDFRNWFRPVEKGLNQLVGAEQHGMKLATFRLRRLQHLLIDLVLLLDEHRVTVGSHKKIKVDAANECVCDECPAPKRKGTDLTRQDAPRLSANAHKLPEP